MGRPDLSAVRRDQILDALERCVARVGLEGASLDAIAEEAGVKRQLIRHYLGNRDDVIRVFGRRLIARLHDELGTLVAALPESGRVDAMLEFLFSGAPGGAADSAASVLLLESMIAAAEREPEFRELVTGYVEALTQVVADELRAEISGARRAAAWEVASGVVAICFNAESLRPLGLPRRHDRAAWGSARRLISTLEASGG